ncbi:uncharacterized protein EV420DRAFT_1647450 [Desarmillaria tabescens]|uniref:Epidermal growth factor receptor-like transmembrane-juxtamembrane segment domain-containing protein n=1 Tax=Armillaria tabescens TaxID=1929756 RepID=A0AA39JTK7_ARMTA|nr:uncharacterized protein EV420DRAFT_1647450 [Desarmillaria tabescens]KAK0448302.1 hypothetical protein EV420DRAFT_1647450 [Desarmillaria tabescens]
MSPAPFQNVQDRRSVYSVSSGVPDLFSSPLKLRGNNNDRNNNNPCRGDSGTKTECVPPGSFSAADSSTTTVSISASSGAPQGSSCSTTWQTQTHTTSITATSVISSVLGTSAENISPSSTSLSSSSDSESAQAASTKSHRNTGAIIGGVIGGVVILSIAALILFFFLRRRRRMKHTAPSAEFLHSNSVFQRLNSVKQGSPLKRTRPSSDGDAHSTSGRTFLQSSPTLEKVAVDTSGHGP